MGKNKDLIQVLLLILIGMFIPFLGAVMINYGYDPMRIAKTFGYFLIIFAVELGLVYAYFTLSNRVAKKQIDKYKPKP